MKWMPANNVTVKHLFILIKQLSNFGINKSIILVFLTTTHIKKRSIWFSTATLFWCTKGISIFSGTCKIFIISQKLFLVYLLVISIESWWTCWDQMGLEKKQYEIRIKHYKSWQNKDSLVQHNQINVAHQMRNMTLLEILNYI